MSRMTQVFFSLCLFLSASLLFIIQPMVAKMFLPFYGGTPAVWTVCMLFFQFLLLFAYGYAWLLSRFFPNPWAWRIVHVMLILLALITFPVVLNPSIADKSPDFVILQDLLFQLGLPLFVVGTSAPILQFAYSQTKGKNTQDPYFLYAASNLGSLLTLLSYPWLIERFIGLKQQFYYWNPFFITYLVLLALTLFIFPYRRLPRVIEEKKALTWRTTFCWLGYSFIPCSLMLGMTFYITTDIAATPLFWILPLTFYLLSFVLTFAQKPVFSHEWVKRNAFFFIIFPLLGFIIEGQYIASWLLITMHLANFFILSLLCHGELVRLRPPVSQLTSFYFCLALGGVLAGLFNGLLAPHIFTGAYEYPFVLALAVLCIPLPRFTSIGLMPFFVLILLLANYFLQQFSWLSFLKTWHVAEIMALIGIVLWPKNRLTLFMGVAVLLLFSLAPWLQQNLLLSKARNFYGIKEVRLQGETHALISQSTVHGFQIKNQENQGDIAYYGPAFAVVHYLQKLHPSLRATILGLGTGMMACQFRKTDQLKIIDIDPQVIQMASDTHLFTYLRDCPPAVTLMQGDGRLVLEKSPPASAEVLIIDAFSSDAIPIHLLTLEAFQLYKQIIAAEGAILIHISNRYLRLLPVLTANGRQLQQIVLHKLQAANAKAGQFASEWVLLTASQPLAAELMRDNAWRFVADNESYLWTDDYSNLVPLLK